MARRLLTPEEAAEVLHVEVRTITKWARQGYIPAHPLGVGNHRKLWRFFADELEKFAAEQSGKSP